MIGTAPRAVVPVFALHHRRATGAHVIGTRHAGHGKQRERHCGSQQDIVYAWF
jgi:hypothetical protein